MLQHLSLFSGIGGATEAIRQSGLDCKTVAFSEINPTTVKMYRALHGDEPEALGDLEEIKIRKLVSFGEIDILTAGFPCQSFSRMGKGLGWKCPRLQSVLNCMTGVIVAVRPRYVLLENVLAIIQNPHHVGWQNFLTALNSIGYSAFVHRGNPLDLGYLQSRSRVYVALTRHDQDPWLIHPVPRVEKQTFTKDPMASVNKNCYKINPKRAKKIFGETDDHFACVTAMAGDSHCTRATWIRDTGIVRGWTLDELYQLFGWNRKPNIEISPRGISRATMYRGFGNSWHVGHASQVLKTSPLHRTYTIGE